MTDEEAVKVAVKVLSGHLTHWERLVSEGICVEDGRITVEALKVAIERMTPNMVEYEADGYADGELAYDSARCPVCGEWFEYEIGNWEDPFCPKCGQALEWHSE